MKNLLVDLTIMAELTFQKLQQNIYILGLAKNFYPKWLNVSEHAG